MFGIPKGRGIPEEFVNESDKPWKRQIASATKEGSKAAQASPGGGGGGLAKAKQKKLVDRLLRNLGRERLDLGQMAGS